MYFLRQNLLKIFIIFLTSSIIYNLIQFKKIKMLEENVWLTKLRLNNFAIETGALIKETKKLTLTDIKKPTILSAPWEEGTGYIINRDSQYSFGIKYLFDKQGYIQGWVPEPDIKFRYKNEKGEEVLRSVKDVVYENK